MKKLFLTSGIIACMACPAFATGFSPIDTDYTNPRDGECVENYLGATSGDVQLVARWTADGHTLTLENNTLDGTSADGTLYTTYDTGAYLDSSRQNLMSSIANPVSPTPTGASVSVTYNANTPVDPTNATPNTHYTWASSPASTSANRTFTGYYASVDSTTGVGTTPYITSNGYINSDGTDRAADLTDDTETWYAGWSCTNQTLATPSTTASAIITGYTFAGWYDAAEGGTQVTADQTGAICPFNDKPLYAHWTKNEHTITYDCSNARATANGQTMTGSTNGNQTVYYDDTITLATASCSWTGYQFQGWRCEKNLTSAETYTGTTANYDDGETGVIFHVDANVTCYAVWQENTINLHWDSDDATAVTTAGSSTCQYDGGLTVPVATKTGYTLQGWDVVEYNAQNVDNSANTVTPQNP